jgi:hypothetical protein
MFFLFLFFYYIVRVYIYIYIDVLVLLCFIYHVKLMGDQGFNEEDYIILDRPLLKA